MIFGSNLTIYPWYLDGAFYEVFYDEIRSQIDGYNLRICQR